MADPREGIFTIEEDASESNAIDFQYLHPCAFDIPALTGTIVKILIKHSKTETGTYTYLKDRDDAYLSLPCDATTARRIQVEPGLFGGLRWVKVVSADTDDAAEAVTGADFEITPALRDYR